MLSGTQCSRSSCVLLQGTGGGPGLSLTFLPSFLCPGVLALSFTKKQQADESHVFLRPHTLPVPPGNLPSQQTDAALLLSVISSSRISLGKGIPAIARHPRDSG